MATFTTFSSLYLSLPSTTINNFSTSLLVNESTSHPWFPHPSLSPTSSPSPSPSPVEEYCFNSSTLESVASPLAQGLLISLYSLTSFVALLGNLVVIVVEVFGTESAANIRKYLINLAISDIIIGVLCVPFTYTDFMLGRWIFPHWLCPTAQYVQLLSVFVTSLTLTIIGIERYMATLHPFSPLHHWLESHTHLMLVCTWVLGGAYASIPYPNTHTRQFTLNGSVYYECSYDNDLTLLKRRLFMTSNFLATFLLPMITLIATYTAIMRKLMHDQRAPPASKKKFKSKGRESSRSNHPKTLPPPTEGVTVVATCKEGVFSSLTPSSYPLPLPPSPPLPPPLPPSSSSPQVPSRVPPLRPTFSAVFQASSPQNGETVTKKSTAQSVIHREMITRTASERALSAHAPLPPPSSGKKLTLKSNIELRRSTSCNYHSKTIKMMFTVILLYGVCWMPIKLYQFLLDYGLISYCTEAQLNTFVSLYFVCHWVAMASSFVNPIVYSFMSRSFRNDFGKISSRFRKTFSASKPAQLSVNTLSTHV